MKMQIGNYPKMILFDYGQTLVAEERFNGIKGTAAVMKHAVKNKYNKTPEEVWYIGDQYRCDVVGAQGIGMFPVWYVGAIDLKYEPVESVLTVENWQELKEHLKECL